MDSDSNKKSISVASVTDSITRIEKILPKVIDNYKSAIGKPANSVDYNEKSAKDKNNQSLIDSLSKQVSSLTRENIELKNENSELANALEDLHQEYMKLESHANNKPGKRQRQDMDPKISDSHTPAKFIDLDQYSDLRNSKKRATRQCANRNCKKKTVWYCVECSNVEENIFKPFCFTTFNS